MSSVIKDDIRQDRLDVLRGIAALYVLINHARGMFFIGGQKLLADHPSAIDYLSVALLQATSLGTEAVILFFVLSGFAMAHSIRFSRSTVSFYLKRIVRIWPPYIAATLLALAVGVAIDARDIQQRVLEVLFYVRPGTSLTPQFWSLPFEVLFYALCPLLLASSRRVTWLLAAAATLSVITVAAYGVMLNPTGRFLCDFAGNELLFFAAGAFAYHHAERIPRFSWRPLLVLSLGFLASAWVAKILVGQPNMLSSLAMIVLSVLLIRNLPDLPQWANIGRFSYSIYIFHFALLAALAWAARRIGIEPGDVRNPLAWTIVVPPVLAGCYLLYLVTERKANAAVARIRQAGRPAPVAASVRDS